MIKDKRGEQEEGLAAQALGLTLGIVASLIVIVFLVVPLIMSIIRDPAAEAAADAADEIENKIKSMEAISESDILLTSTEKLNEEGWSIAAWSKSNQSRPDKCFFSSCICICKGTTPDECQNTGKCREFEIPNIKIKSYSLTTLGGMGEYFCGLYSSSTIPMEKNAVIIDFNKTFNSVELIHYRPSYFEHYQYCKDKTREIESPPLYY